MAIITPDSPNFNGPAFGTAARDVGTPAYDPKKHDPFFDGLSDQLADKGFITAASDDLVTWARTGPYCAC